MNQNPMLDLSKTELLVMKVLDDGERHRNYDLAKSIDEYTSNNVLNQHIQRMRKKLKAAGYNYEIICEYCDKMFFYRLIKKHQPGDIRFQLKNS